MEKRGSKGGVSFSFRQHLRKVRDRTRPTRGDDWYGHCLCNGACQLQIKACQRPVGIHTGEQNLTGTEGAYRPGGSLQKGGVRPPATGDYQAWKPD